MEYLRFYFETFDQELAANVVINKPKNHVKSKSGKT
jgi:hypothetical protein